MTTTFSASVPQMRIDLDREKAMTLGVPVNEVFETLQSTFGALYVNDFNRSGRVYQVQLQSEPRFRAYPEDIRNVYVRCAVGRARAADRDRERPRSDRSGNRRALQCVQRRRRSWAARAPGYSSGDAIEVDGGARRGSLAARLPARVDGYGVSGEGERRRVTGRVSARRVDGVPDSRCAVRALDAAGRGDSRRAVRGVRRVARGVPARSGERHLLPDRHADARRSRGEERDPDRRVRDDEVSRGHGARGCGDRRREACASVRSS